MRQILGMLLLLGLLAVGRAARAEGEREAVPSPADQAKAEKLVKEIFAQDYLKTRPTDRLALSVQLLKQAVETKDDAAARYVLLRESSLLAARIGALEQALKGVDELTRSFDVSGAALKAEVCEAAASSSMSKVSSGSLAAAALAASAEALENDEFELAARLLKVAQPAAVRSKTVALVRAAEVRGLEIEQLKRESEKVKLARVVLETKPDDASANLVVGRYLCLLKGEWGQGLPHLAKVGDADLKALAAKDLAGPTAASGQVEVGDGWYDLSASQQGLGKLHLQERAHFWYQQAAPSLAGLTKTRIDKRLADLKRVAPTVATPAAAPKSEWVVLFRSADPRLWNQDVNAGKEGFAIELKKAPEKIEYLKLSYPAKSDFVIVPVTRDKLLGLSDDGRYGWNGTNKYEYDGYHLAVYDNLGDAVKKRGSICVLVPGAFRGLLGWGFGHDGLRKTQGWTWAGENLAPTVFEIAVKAGPLTEAEAKKLLKK